MSDKFIFQENSSYDIVLKDIDETGIVSFSAVDEADQEQEWLSNDDFIIKKALELKQQGLIGGGKTLPVRVATFGYGVPYKFYSFSNFV